MQLCHVLLFSTSLSLSLSRARGLLCSLSRGLSLSLSFTRSLSLPPTAVVSIGQLYSTVSTNLDRFLVAFIINEHF